MPKKSSNIAFPELPRLKQKSNDHCGPAVLSMLAAFYGESLTQNEVVAAAQAEDKLNEHGVTIFDMAKAVNVLAQNLTLWHKHNATIRDVELLVHKYKIPVGVEWQGDFAGFSDDDNGHYSIITDVDTGNKFVLIADSFWRWAGRDRKISLSRFIKRWWDENEIIDKKGRKKILHDKHLILILVKKTRRFPVSLGMQKTPSTYAR